MTNFAKVQTTLKQFVYFLHADWPRQPKLFGKFTLRTDDAWPDTDFEVLRSVFWETLPCGTIYAQMTAPTCIDVEFRQLIGIRDEGQERSFTRAFEVWGRWRFGDGWECTPAEADPTPAPASGAAGDDQVMTAGGGEQRGANAGTPEKVREAHRRLKSGEAWKTVKQGCAHETYMKWCLRVTGEDPITK